MKKLLVVGTGNCQANAIKRGKQLGYYIIAVDNSEVTSVKATADQPVQADTMNVESILRCAKEYEVDGIMAIGNDQSFLTACKVSEALDLRYSMDSEIAVRIINKKLMKQRFVQFKLPTAPFVIIRKNFGTPALMSIKPPYVIKPIDATGKRGIYKVDTIDEIRKFFDEVIKFSNEDEIMVEQFYESKEVTVSGWVYNGIPSILTLTDRLTVPLDNHINVCTAHQSPSVFSDQFEKIENLTKQICNHFDINNGPFNIQMLIGEKGIWINDISCCLGDAYEDLTIPFATGIDIMDLTITTSMGLVPKVAKSDLITNNSVFKTLVFYSKPGNIMTMTPISNLKKLPYVIDAGYKYRLGDTIKMEDYVIHHAGYVIITGEDEKEIEDNSKKVFKMFEILDEQGNNMVVQYGMD